MFLTHERFFIDFVINYTSSLSRKKMNTAINRQINFNANKDRQEWYEFSTIKREVFQ